MKITPPPSKFLQFHKARKQNPKTWIYLVRTNGTRQYLLGVIKWYAPWRQYGFFPEGKPVFEKTCMQDITKFLIVLNKAQRTRNIKPMRKRTGWTGPN